MDAVKMTKRDLNEELTDSQMNRPYDSPHSLDAPMASTALIWN